MSHTATLRTLIQAPDLLVMPGIFDGFSARLVAQTGFAAGFITGAGLSETLLGWSDAGLMGFELNLAAVTRLAACCTLPLLADADTGYGNAVNVYHTARAFEQAGVAGLMLEDQTWPKRCGYMQGKEVIRSCIAILRIIPMARKPGKMAPFHRLSLSRLCYDAPLTSRYSDRRHHPWPVYGLLTCSPAPPNSWI